MKKGRFDEPFLSDSSAFHLVTDLSWQLDHRRHHHHHHHHHHLFHDVTPASPPFLSAHHPSQALRLRDDALSKATDEAQRLRQGVESAKRAARRDGVNMEYLKNIVVSGARRSYHDALLRSTHTHSTAVRCCYYRGSCTTCSSNRDTNCSSAACPCTVPISPPLYFFFVYF